MDAQVSFIGKVVPSGKSVTIAAAYDDDEFETIHFTQVALGPKPAKGPHTIFIENEDGKFAVGTLDREKCTQFSMDITIASDDVTISHSGESEVHLTGYKTVAYVGLDDGEDYEDGDEDELRLYRKGRLGSSSDDDEEEEEEDEEEEESSEDDEPPRAVPLQKKKRQLVEVEASEGSEEEEEEEEEEDDSSEEDISDSESEEEELELPSKSAKRKKAAAAAAQTPQPAKKAKKEEKAPATAPAKVNATNGGESQIANDKEFAEALKSFLQKNGPCKLSVLGSSVKRPPKSPKFKKIIEQNSDIFSFNPVTDTVSLAN